MHSFKVFFNEIPSHFPFHKKMALALKATKIGKVWDGCMLILSLVSCFLYIAETTSASTSYNWTIVFKNLEAIMTYLFTADMFLRWLCTATLFQFVVNGWTVIDVMTILPFFITLAMGTGNSHTSVLRFARILRLMRILRGFGRLRELSVLKRQIVSAALSIGSLVMISAGIFQLLENEVKQQMEYDCRFSGRLTGYLPSCSPYFPATSDCDCRHLSCQSFYQFGDEKGKPTSVRCEGRSFLNSLYFVVVTSECVISAKLKKFTVFF